MSLNQHADKLIRAALSILSPYMNYAVVGPDDPIEQNTLVFWEPILDTTTTINDILSSDPLSAPFIAQKQKTRLGPLIQSSPKSRESLTMYMMNKWASYLLKLQVKSGTFTPNICKIVNNVDLMNYVVSKLPLTKDQKEFLKKSVASVYICEKSSVLYKASNNVPYAVFISRAAEKCLKGLKFVQEGSWIEATNQISIGEWIFLNEDIARKLLCATEVLASHIAVMKANSPCAALLKQQAILSGPGGFRSWEFGDLEAPLKAIFSTVMSSKPPIGDVKLTKEVITTIKKMPNIRPQSPPGFFGHTTAPTVATSAQIPLPEPTSYEKTALMVQYLTELYIVSFAIDVYKIFKNQMQRL